MKDIVKQSFSSPVSDKLRKAVLALDQLSCGCCFKGKAVSQSAPKKSEPREYKPGEHFSTDIAGPFPLQRGGFKYFIVWVDFCTKIYFIFIYSSANSDLVVRSFLIIDTELSNRTGRHVRIVNCDNGAGYQSNFKRACQNLDATIRNCVPYNHGQNGGAERPIRTLKEGGTTNLIQSKLNDKFLFDGVRHFAYTRQVVPENDGVSIHEKYYNTAPHPIRLVPFGCSAGVVIPRELRL
jgi:hypothetical protein